MKPSTDPTQAKRQDAPANAGGAGQRDSFGTDGVVVERSRVLEWRRSDPDRYSVDDEAAVEFGPGLLRFLSLGDANRFAIGLGGAFEWTIPVGAAGTAAYAVLEPRGFESVNTWTGVRNTIRWHRCCRADETLVARCRLASLGRLADTPYRVWSREAGDLIVEGRFEFASVARDDEGFYAIEPRRLPTDPVPARTKPPRSAPPGHEPAPAFDEDPSARRTTVTSDDLDRLGVWTATAPARSEPGESVAAPLFVLRPPRVMRSHVGGDGETISEWLFPRDLLRLLGHPIAGGSEPLGRRHHPYGRILEGMGLHAALAMSGGGAPRELSVEWWEPTSGEHDFRIRSRLRASSEAIRASVHDVYEGERPVGRVRVSVAVMGGAAEGATA